MNISDNYLSELSRSDNYLSEDIFLSKILPIFHSISAQDSVDYLCSIVNKHCE